MFKILVVDDELTSTQLIKRILEMVGYEVSEASNGREALNIIREIQPDLIITDIMMPEMNGYQLIKLMRQNPEYANIQIIAMSA
ncbi:MAG: response regulator, partial [Chloroflexota bacterium]